MGENALVKAPQESPIENVPSGNSRCKYLMGCPVSLRSLISRTKVSPTCYLSFDKMSAISIPRSPQCCSQSVHRDKKIGPSEYRGPLIVKVKNLQRGTADKMDLGGSHRLHQLRAYCLDIMRCANKNCATHLCKKRWPYQTRRICGCLLRAAPSPPYAGIDAKLLPDRCGRTTRVWCAAMCSGSA